MDNMANYIVFCLLVLAVFFVWFLFFSVMRKEGGRKLDLLGFLFLGPVHVYLKKRGYVLSRRELIGWVVVLFLMLLAPWITSVL